jgi:hypothetical protein
MCLYSAVKVFLLTIAAAAWISLPVSDLFQPKTESAAAQHMLCPSGQSRARLTGWMLGNKTPVGSATYDEAKRQLAISVESVGLEDGKVLSVLIGDERIGQLQPLKDGKATGAINQTIPDGARVRVFDVDRPIVSANLACADALVPTATISPMMPSPTASPTIAPSPTVSPAPSVTPSPTVSPDVSPTATPDGMPKRSPVPTPSPGTSYFFSGGS